MKFWSNANKVAARFGASLEDDGAEDFVKDLFVKYSGEPTSTECKAWLSKVLQNSFVSIKDPPSWAGELFWPFHSGVPMIFLYQFTISSPNKNINFPLGDTIYVFCAKNQRSVGEFSVLYRIVSFDEDGNRNLPSSGVGDIEF